MTCHSTPSTSRVLLQTNHPLGPRPPEPLRHLYRHVPQRLHHPIPIDALVPRIAVGRRLLVVEDPVVRDNTRVVVAHDALAQIVDAVLVVALVHLRHGIFRGALLGEVVLAIGVDVVVLPEVVQAVEVVGATRDGDVAVTPGEGPHGGWEKDGRGVSVLAGELDGGGGGGDGAEGCSHKHFTSQYDDPFEG